MINSRVTLFQTYRGSHINLNRELLSRAVPIHRDSYGAAQILLPTRMMARDYQNSEIDIERFIERYFSLMNRRLRDRPDDFIALFQGREHVILADYEGNTPRDDARWIMPDYAEKLGYWLAGASRQNGWGLMYVGHLTPARLEV